MVKPTAQQPEMEDPISTSPLIEKISDTKSNLFPILGIGASAGGLEALEQLLRSVDVNTGIAYIVVQHLDPTQKGMLPELLQRITKMKVFQAKENMHVHPNCVYVIPPNKYMSILKRKLHLFEPTVSRGMRLPVDFFLRSLADDHRELSIGLILSGMGSDGSIGLGAIKEKDGITLVQDPDSAKFDSMPRNAIESVIVDIVAPPNELIQKLMELIKHIPVDINPESAYKDKSSLGKIIVLLRTHIGHDFSLYKKNSVYRRIERRMAVHKIDKISSYVQFLQDNLNEINILFKELLIGVTNFFRDTEVWVKIEKNIIPDIIARLQSGSYLRAWVTACSTGEEAYSLAISFKEVLRKTTPKKSIALQIFATDLDNEAIELARKGTFSENIVSDVSPDILRRYFVKTDNGYRINNDIREMIVFAQQNLIMNPPFTKIDFLMCRNLLIYLDPELQKKLIELFYHSINNNGIMVLGNSENLGTLSNLFQPVDAKLKIYKRSDTAVSSGLLNFPFAYSRNLPEVTDKHKVPEPIQNIETLANQMLLQHFSPPGVLVNENGDILFISGSTGKYLEPAVGKANLNIFAMLRVELRNEFPIAFYQAIRKKGTFDLRNVKVTGENRITQSLHIKIKWIDNPGMLKGLIMVTFNDVDEIPVLSPASRATKKSSSSNREQEMEEEVQKMRDEMQSSVEEMQATEEELKSANEELQSSNEELQSTNEELTSSKEELQSLNEELSVVNSELQIKVDDFVRMDNDMRNLLNSTDIATLFLDKELKIRRFTDKTANIIKLINTDIGRPFTDQVSGLIYPEIVDDANEVLRTLIYSEKQVPARDGQWYSVRIMPYRTFDERIDGLVITFINITYLKNLEVKLTDTEKRKNILINASSDVVIVLSTTWKVLEFNPEAEIFFGIKPYDAVNQNFIQLLTPAAERKKTEKVMNKLLHEVHDSKFKMQVLAARGNMPLVEWAFVKLPDNQKMTTEVILIMKR